MQRKQQFVLIPVGEHNHLGLGSLRPNGKYFSGDPGKICDVDPLKVEPGQLQQLLDSFHVGHGLGHYDDRSMTIFVFGEPVGGFFD